MNDSSENQISHHFHYFDFVIGVIEDVVVLPEFQVSRFFFIKYLVWTYMGDFFHI